MLFTSSISNSDLTNIYENKKEIYKHQKICHYNGNIIISAVFNPRSVPDNIRSYAFGLQFAFQRSLGFIPGPIIYGWLFDTRCLVWAESCGRRGNCQFYDVHSLSYGIMLLAGSFHGNFEIRFLIHFYLFMFYLCIHRSRVTKDLRFRYIGAASKIDVQTSVSRVTVLSAASALALSVMRRRSIKSFNISIHQP